MKRPAFQVFPPVPPRGVGAGGELHAVLVAYSESGARVALRGIRDSDEVFDAASSVAPQAKALHMLWQASCVPSTGPSRASSRAHVMKVAVN